MAEAIATSGIFPTDRCPLHLKKNVDKPLLEIATCDEGRAAGALSAALLNVSASADEIANSLFVSTLRKTALPLGEFVAKQLARKYGGASWLQVARRNFSRSIQQHLVDGQLRDVYVITELLLAHLDQVFLAESVDFDNVGDITLRLSKIAEEIEGVVQTRTWLFHTFRVSTPEVCRSMLMLRRLFERFCLEDAPECSMKDIRCSISGVRQLLNQAKDGRLRSATPASNANLTGLHSSWDGGHWKIFLPREELETILLLQTFTTLKTSLSGLVKNGNNSKTEKNGLPHNDANTLWDSDDLKEHLDKLLSRRYPHQTASTVKCHVSSSLRPELKVIRRMRNQLAHENSINSEEMRKFIKSACTVEKTICGETSESHKWLVRRLDSINQLHKVSQSSRISEDSQKPLFKVAVRTKATLSIRITEPPPLCLIGRDAILEKIVQLCKNSCSTAGYSCMRLLLHGPPGIGKSALVRAVASRLSGCFPMQYTFYGATEQSLLTNTVLFLQSEGLVVTEQTAWPIFQECLHHPARSMLLIFEDIQNPAMILPLLPADNHCVICTSHSDKAWNREPLATEPSHFLRLRVEGLDTNSSFAMVEEIFKSRQLENLFNEQYVKNFCRGEKLRRILEEEMGNFPLAVRLVAYQLLSQALTGKSISASNCLSSNEPDKRSECDHQAAGRVHIRGYHHLVRYALRTISNSPNAQRMSLVFALLSGQGIPKWLLIILCHPLMSSLDVEVASEELVYVGLIDITAEGNFFCMHSFVQREVRKIFSHHPVKDTVVSTVCGILDYCQREHSGSLYGLGPEIIGSGEAVYGSDSLYHKCQIKQAIHTFLSHAEEICLDWYTHVHFLSGLANITNLNSRGWRSCRGQKNIWDRISELTAPHAEALLSLPLRQISSMHICALMDYLDPDSWLEKAALFLKDHPRHSSTYITILNSFLWALFGAKRCNQALKLLFILGERVPQLIKRYLHSHDQNIYTTMSTVCQLYIRLKRWKEAEACALSLISLQRSMPHLSPTNHQELAGLSSNVGEVVARVHHYRRALWWQEAAIFLLNAGEWHYDQMLATILALRICRCSIRYCHELVRPKEAKLVFYTWLHRLVEIKKRCLMADVEVNLVCTSFAEAMQYLVLCYDDKGWPLLLEIGETLTRLLKHHPHANKAFNCRWLCWVLLYPVLTGNRALFLDFLFRGLRENLQKLENVQIDQEFDYGKFFQQLIPKLLDGFVFQQGPLMQNYFLSALTNLSKLLDNQDSVSTLEMISMSSAHSKKSQLALRPRWLALRKLPSMLASFFQKIGAVEFAKCLQFVGKLFEEILADNELASSLECT